MSLIKIIRAQLGLSGTATNNFTLDASADDGTVKFARGNAGATTQDLITVAANNAITLLLTEYADDTAAATGGIPIGGLYKTSGTVKVRVT